MVGEPGGMNNILAQTAGDALVAVATHVVHRSVARQAMWGRPVHPEYTVTASGSPTRNDIFYISSPLECMVLMTRSHNRPSASTEKYECKAKSTAFCAKFCSYQMHSAKIFGR